MVHGEIQDSFQILASIRDILFLYFWKNFAEIFCLLFSIEAWILQLLILLLDWICSQVSFYWILLSNLVSQLDFEKLIREYLFRIIILKDVHHFISEVTGWIELDSLIFLVFFRHLLKLVTLDLEYHILS